MIILAATGAAMESRVRGETFQGHWAQLRGIAAMQGRRMTLLSVTIDLCDMTGNDFFICKIMY